MEDRLKEISDIKGVFDFKPQITNDFLGLAVIGLKNSVVRNNAGRKSAIGIIKKYCDDAAVKEALASHTMNHLQITIRMFLLLMKGRIYAVCYLICKLFFNK